MLLVAGLCLIHLLSAAIFVCRFARPIRAFDCFVAVSLVAFGTFFGLPITIGWATGTIGLTSCTLITLFVGMIAICFRRKSLSCLFSHWESFSRLESALLILIGAILLGVFMAGLRLPYRYSDAIGYHIHSVLRWALDGRFVLDSFGDHRLDGYSGTPEGYANVKAVFPLMILQATRSLNGTGLVQWPFLVLMIASTYAIARRMELPRWISLVVVLFSFVAPEILQQSTDGYTDVALTACTLALVSVLLSINHDGFRWFRVLLAALGFAGMAGLKPVGLVLCATLGLLFLVLVVISQAPTIKIRLQRMFLSLSAVLVIAFAIAGPWYVHGARKFQNPIYPLQVKVGSKIIFDGPYPASINNEWVMMYTKKQGLAAWWNMMRENNPIPTMASWESGLGAQAFILGIPALIAFVLLGLCGRRALKLNLPIMILFTAVTLGSPTLIVPRLAMYQLHMMGLAFGWVLFMVPTLYRFGLGMALGVLLSYNLALTIPAILYRTRPPELWLYALTSGHTKWIQTSSFPEDVSASDFWQEATAAENTIVGIAQVEGDVSSFLSEGLQGGMVRVPPYKDNEDPAVWLKRVRSTGATHLWTLAGSAEDRMAVRRQDLLRQIFRRLDSSGEHPWFFRPQKEAVLYEILPEINR